MKTPLSILLRAAGGIRNEVNTFPSDCAVPMITVLLIMEIGIGVVMNYDKIIDRNRQGARREDIVDLLWVAGYIIIGPAIIAAAIALINSKLKVSL